MEYATQQSFKKHLKKLSPDARQRVKAQNESEKCLIITQDGIQYTNRVYEMSCACGYSGKAAIVVIYLDNPDMYSDMYCPNCGDM